jgi:hypothetical protein
MRRVTGLIAAATIVIGASSCGSDDEATPATPESSAVTTAPQSAPATTATTNTTPDTDLPTTAPTTTQRPDPAPVTDAPTTTGAAVPTTSGVTEGFDPPCTESTDGPPVTGGALAREEFGPLATNPALVLELPAVRTMDERDEDLPVAVVEPIDGGVLVALRSSDLESGFGTLLAAVADDGTVAWVRCLQETVVEVATAPGAGIALMRTASTDAAGTWQRIDLTSGSVAPSGALFPEGEQWGEFALARSDTALLFGPDRDIPITDPALHRLLLVDLAAESSETIPMPAEAAGLEMFQLQFALAESADFVLIDRSGGAPAVATAFHDGVWTKDPEVLAGTFGPQAAFLIGDSGPRLTGYDARGRVLWQNEDVSTFSGEGFFGAASGDVFVVAGCWEPVDAGMCDMHEVGGIDIATGEVLWHLPDNRGVGPVGDGYALVTDGDEAGGYLMIDTDTGDAVDGQAWDDATLFSTACCGDESLWTERSGGGVVTFHGRTIRVFVPDDLATGTATVTLP